MKDRVGRKAAEMNRHESKRGGAKRLTAGVVLAAALAGGLPARSQTYVWNADVTPSSWATAANWAGGTNFADGIGHVADFSILNITGSRRHIRLDDSAGDGLITVGTLRIGDLDRPYTFSNSVNGTTWLFADADGLAEIDIVSAWSGLDRPHRIDGTIALSNDLRVTTRQSSTSSALWLWGGVTQAVAGVSLTKAGAGDLKILTNLVDYSGSTVVENGRLILSTGGVLAATSGITLTNRGCLVLDNGGINLGNRIPDAAPIRSWGGGLVWTHTAAAATDYSETLGALQLNRGHLSVSATPSATSQLSTLTFASAARLGGATVRFDAPGLGGASNAIVFTTAPALTGGGGTSGDILPWALVRVATNGTGSDYQLVTHDGDGTSLRAYGTGAGEAYVDGEATWAVTANARPAVDVSYGGTARSLNALVLDDGIDLLGVSADRQLLFNAANSSALIVQTGGSSSLTNSGGFEVIPQFGANQGIFHILGTLSLYRDTQNQGLRGTGGIVKTGPGTLSLGTASQANNGTLANNLRGTFAINEGTLELRNAFAAGGTVLELSGGTLALRNNGGTAFRAQDVALTNTPLIVRQSGTVVVARVTAGPGLTHTLGAITLGAGTTLTLSPDTFNTGAQVSYALASSGIGLEGDAGLFIQPAPGGGDGQFITTNVTDGGLGFSLSVRGSGGALFHSEFAVREKLSLAGSLLVAADGGGSAAVKTADGFTNVAGNILIGNGVLVSSINVVRPVGSGAGQVRFAGGAAAAAGIGSLGVPTTFAFTTGGATGLLAWGSADFNLGTLVLNEDDAGARVTLLNGLDLNSGAGSVTRTVQVDSDVAEVAGAVTNTGAGTASLNKTGAAALSLAGPLSWNGTTTLSAGTLRIPNVTNLPAGNLAISAANSAPVLESAGVFTRALGTGADQVAINGSTANNSRPGFSAFGGDLTLDFGGDGAGTGAELAWNTTGFNPDGPNVANSGALLLNTADADGTLLLLNDLDFNGSGETGVGARRFEINGSVAVLAGDIRNSGAGFFDPIGLFKRGTGTLVLTGDNTYDGGTTVNAGTLAIGAGGAGGTLGAGPVTNNGAIEFNRSASYIVANLISGSGSVAQFGAGTLVLSADNPYGGPTTVSNGTLRIHGTHSGSGLITVAGGTLGGTGTVAGSIRVGSAGTLAPGDSIGTLSGPSLTLDGGATLAWELGNDGATADRVALSGALLKGAAGAWTFDFLGTGAVGTYTLLTFASTDFADGDFAVSNLSEGLGGSIAVGGTEITLTVVPEPASLGMLSMLGIAGWLLRRRAPEA